MNVPALKKEKRADVLSLWFFAKRLSNAGLSVWIDAFIAGFNFTFASA